MLLELGLPRFDTLFYQ